MQAEPGRESESLSSKSTFKCSYVTLPKSKKGSLNKLLINGITKQTFMSLYSSLMQGKWLFGFETYFLTFTTLPVLDRYLLPTSLDLFFQLFFSLLRIYSVKFHNLGCGSKRFALPASCVYRQK